METSSLVVWQKAWKWNCGNYEFDRNEFHNWEVVLDHIVDFFPVSGSTFSKNECNKRRKDSTTTKLLLLQTSFK